MPDGSGGHERGPEAEHPLRTLILGISGAVGGRLARELAARGDDVYGIVRTTEQQDAVHASGGRASIGDLATLTVDELSARMEGHDVVVFAAGSNGGARDVTTAIDGDAAGRAAEAARTAGVRRFVLVSVLPEAWRERDLEDDEEYYFAVKKRTEVELVRTDLDWVILRPSLLTDDPGRGAVSLGPAELHGSVSRDDVAAVLAEIVHEPRIRRRILELDGGSTPTPIADAVRAAADG